MNSLSLPIFLVCCILLLLLFSPLYRMYTDKLNCEAYLRYHKKWEEERFNERIREVEHDWDEMLKVGRQTEHGSDH